MDFTHSFVERKFNLDASRLNNVKNKYQNIIQKPYRTEKDALGCLQTLTTS